MPELAGVILFALGLAFVVLLIIYVVVPMFALVGKLVGHIFGFISSMFRDSLRALSAIITMIILAPLIVGSIVIGRWSASAHFGRAIQYECVMFGRSLYRVAIGNPARLLGLSMLTDGIEHRIPEAVGNAPRADKPSRRTGQFEGYTIVGSLPVGGSGARMYIAQPDEKKLASFARTGHTNLDQVVIKSFSVRDGSSLPQIIRESRALEAAKKLGLILEHDLNEHRFYYVMEYVPGDDLAVTTRKLHDESGPDGLGARQLTQAVGYVADLLATLDRYHRGGLWHKDVKPDNIIIHNGQVHLVDLGLVTPMRSAMTLTTHGTEYFRDPEMVRMALKGVKVHEVDGAKFDIFAVGAVLYSLVENSFPAHGGLSHFTKRCPDALRLIIRRAMSEYNSRYTSAPQMLADLRVVMNAANPYAVKPADLPSMRSDPGAAVAAAAEEFQQPYSPATPSPAAADPAFAPAPQTPAAAAYTPEQGRVKPRLRVTNWMRGRYISDTPPASRVEQASYKAASPVRRSPRPAPMAGPRPSAAEQLHRAQSRAKAARRRAHERMRHHSKRWRHRFTTGRYNNSPNFGVAVGLLITLAALVGSGLIINANRDKVREIVHRAQHGVAQVAPNANAPADTNLSENEVARRIVESVYSTLESFDTLDWDTIRPQLKETFQTILAEGSHYADGASNATATAGGGATATASAVAPSQGELLVLDDLTTAPAAIHKKFLDGLTNNAHHVGFTLRGLDPSDEETNFLAQARKTFGDPTQESFPQQVRSWLAQQPDSIKGVVRLHWVGTDDDQRPAIQIVARPNMDANWLRNQLQSE